MPTESIKLSSIFNSNRGYQIEKLYQGIDNVNAYKRVARNNIEIISRMYNSFKATFEENYQKLGDFQGVRELLSELNYPIIELKKFFHEEDNCINDDTARIFTFFIACKIEELKELSKDIEA